MTCVCACGRTDILGNEDDMNSSQAPGEIREDIFYSSDGRFTLEAEDGIWEVSELDGYTELRMTENPSVAITFSYLEGVPEEILDQFETEFALSYAESLSEVYSGVVLEEFFQPDKTKAGFSLRLTEPGSGQAMYQLFYLAIEAEEGYMITSILPEEEKDRLAAEVRETIESFSFQKK